MNAASGKRRNALKHANSFQLNENWKKITYYVLYVCLRLHRGLNVFPIKDIILTLRCINV